MNINFAYSNYDRYKQLIKIDNMAKQGQKLRSMQKREKHVHKRNGMESEISVIKAKILEEATNYCNLINNNKVNEVKNAFIVFRTMEGAARMI